MADWLPITTAIKNPETGGALTGGHLIATILPSIQLAGGGLLAGYRQTFAIDAGQAEQADGGTMELPITEDASPPAPVYLEIYDANGRLSDQWVITVPRPAGAAPYSAVNLETLI